MVLTGLGGGRERDEYSAGEGTSICCTHTRRDIRTYVRMYAHISVFSPALLAGQATLLKFWLKPFVSRVFPSLFRYFESID